MASNPTTDTHRRPRTGALRRWLALASVLISLTATSATSATSAAASLKPINRPESATAAQAASAPAPTTVLKETVVKTTHSQPALPIVLAAVALAVALAAVALTRVPHR